MKFIKGRWFPVMVVAIIVFIMGMFGWRFTFAPELENSWDAISAVATWVGAIGTTAAVFSAIYIAYRSVSKRIDKVKYPYLNSANVVFINRLHTIRL